MNQFQKVAHKQAEIQSLVGMFLNRSGYSDVTPVGQVVQIIGKTTLLVRRVKTTTEWPVNKHEMQFHVGGFAAHCSNSYHQKWEYELTDEYVKVRVSKTDHYLCADNEPRRYYDYNF
jgi:hypothetical protein